jgi:DNA-binding transcriptional MocR family regulator
VSWRVVKCVLGHHDDKVGGVDLLVLLYLANHANGDDGSGAWPSQPTLAAEAGVHRATVQRALERLADVGAVEVDPRAGRTHRFRVRMCAVCLPRPTAAQSGTRTNPPAAESDRGAAESYGTRRTVRHDSVKEPPPEPPNAVSASPPVDNSPAARPAGVEGQEPARNRKAEFVTRKVEQIRAEQGDRAADAYLATVARNDAKDQARALAAQLASAYSPEGYRPYVPAWAADTWASIHGDGAEGSSHE